MFGLHVNFKETMAGKEFEYIIWWNDNGRRERKGRSVNELSFTLECSSVVPKFVGFQRSV